MSVLSLALLLTACGKEKQFHEQVTAPLSLEMSYGDCAFSDQFESITTGKIRYIIRTFPVGAIYGETEPVQEFVIFRDLRHGFDHTAILDMYIGSYDVMVWSDLIEEGESDSCYNVDDFGEIAREYGYTGNNEYRIAFRGVAAVDVKQKDVPVSVKVKMESPMARFELVSDDLQQFVASQTDLVSGAVAVEDYTAVVVYSGYVPDVYSLYADKPVDSATGVRFLSPMTRVNDTEVSLGLDYVFVGEKSSSVTVKVGVYDTQGQLVSVSAPVKLTLQRGECNVKTSNFLTSSPSLDGIYIDTDFEGSFDIEL